MKNKQNIVLQDYFVLGPATTSFTTSLYDTGHCIAHTIGYIF
jgi:hypothetical protein